MYQELCGLENDLKYPDICAVYDWTTVLKPFGHISMNVRFLR